MKQSDTRLCNPTGSEFYKPDQNLPVSQLSVEIGLTFSRSAIPNCDGIFCTQVIDTIAQEELPAKKQKQENIMDLFKKLFFPDVFTHEIPGWLQR